MAAPSNGISANSLRQSSARQGVTSWGFLSPSANYAAQLLLVTHRCAAFSVCESSNSLSKSRCVILLPLHVGLPRPTNPWSEAQRSTNWTIVSQSLATSYLLQSQLWLISGGTDHHEKALDLMFHHFAAKKDSQLPALKEIQLSRPASADNAYKDQCVRLLAETEKVGVVLHLEPWPSSVSMTWDGEQRQCSFPL